MQPWWNRILPFFLVGFSVVALVFGLVLLTYLFLFAAVVGLSLYIIKRVRRYFGGQTTPLKPKTTPKQGRTFDSDDWKRL